ncbi:hypothetical protein NIES2134_116960 [Thermostichus vulcanus NIES-2134]|nr:hypothetical protein NIES2134_116960 [Thermostichus vulcanus NIES-2134]
MTALRKLKLTPFAPNPHTFLNLFFRLQRFSKMRDTDDAVLPILPIVILLHPCGKNCYKSQLLLRKEKKFSLRPLIEFFDPWQISIFFNIGIIAISGKSIHNKKYPLS